MPQTSFRSARPRVPGLEKLPERRHVGGGEGLLSAAGVTLVSQRVHVRGVARVVPGPPEHFLLPRAHVLGVVGLAFLAVGHRRYVGRVDEHLHVPQRRDASRVSEGVDVAQTDVEPRFALAAKLPETVEAAFGAVPEYGGGTPAGRCAR